jgi:hypothetical protein
MRVSAIGDTVPLVLILGERGPPFGNSDLIERRVDDLSNAGIDNLIALGIARRGK